MTTPQKRMNLFLSRAKAVMIECRVSNLKSKLHLGQNSTSEDNPDWVLNEFGFPVLASDHTQTAPGSKVYEILDQISR